MRRYDDDWYFPPSTPRAARGGIKAQSKRGGFGESWWSQRWLATLESFQLGARLNRGRSYARKGQVVSIDIEKGSVTAAVQGSRPRPYQVAVKLRPIPTAGWEKVVRAFAGQARFAAQLLAGHLPEEAETLFREAGASLFPERLDDLKTSCSCPDWSNPCKHIAAVYYLLAEEFDRDAFLIFRLRGLTREELLARLAPTVSGQEVAEPPAERVPLPADAAAFWRGGELADDWLGEVPAAPAAAALPARLGPFPLWRGSESLPDALATVYGYAARHAREVFEQSSSGE